MKKLSKLLLSLAITAFAVICFAVGCFAADENKDGKWIAAWGTGPTDVSIAQYDNVAFIGKDLSARTVITPTASGDKIRLRFSNYYGEAALTLDSVTIAKSKYTDSINPDSATSDIIKTTLKQVTFNGGDRKVTIPIGQEIYSDEITFEIEAMKNIAISMYIKNPSVIRTMGLSGGTTYLSLNGNKTKEPSFGLSNYMDDAIIKLITAFMPNFKPEIGLAYSLIRVVPILSGIDIRSDKDAYSVCVIGDSTVSNEFPLYLADQINNSYGVHNVGVLGKGIIGNMLCGSESSLGSNLYGRNLLKRFEQDVAKQTGIKYVVVKIGGNDILHPVCGEDANEENQPSANDLIEGFKKICDMTHEMGAKVILATITQWKGTTRDYFGAGASYVRTDSEFEHDWQIAKDINKWIKDPANKYVDGYVDYVGLSADKNDPAKYADKYTEDYIHPNQTLQQKWAENFPMALIGVHRKTQSIKLSLASTTLYVGGNNKVTVKAEIAPSNAENKKLIWSTSDKSVAEISATSSNSVTILAKKDGSAIITCNAADGGSMAKFLVKVKTNPSSIKIKETLSLYARESKTLTASVLPSNAYDKSVTWKSSNTKVATVNSKGVVTGVGKGAATIICTTKAGSKTAKCTVTVKRPTDVTSVYTTVNAKSINIGKTYTIAATVSPSNATFKALSWKSSNTKVATVDQNGKVKAVGAGTATITCASKDNPTAVSKVKITVVVKATGIKLEASKVSIYRTTSQKLKVTFTPSDATNKAVTWKSGNTKVATVDKNGVVKGIKAGKATITCTSKDGGFIAKCTVEVKEIVASKSVALNVSSRSVTVGKTYKLTATVSPSNATLKNVSWKSSNSKIASVDKNGVVKGIKAGKATITCTTNDSGKTAKCEITVKNVVASSVALNKTNITITTGTSATLKATVLPENTYNKNVTWSSSNTSVATVSSSGKITAKKPGTATITCKTVSGGKTATCTVKVSGIKVDSISLSNFDIKVPFGKTAKLTATVSPSNATNKKLAWTTSNPGVAVVDSNGNITAVEKGNAVITCIAMDGSGVSASCTVTVTKKSVLGVELNTTSLSMSKGAQFKLVPTFYPTDATDKGVIWSTSNASVATVDANGVVTAVGTGSCVIKATARDGGYVAKCNVKVTK